MKRAGSGHRTANGSRRWRNASATSGFTLIEVLLTLCLLVIMGAMAWPQLEKTFSNQRLRKAADIIRTQWTKARVESMSAGCIRIFRFEIAGNKFRVEGLTAGSVAMQNGTSADPVSTDATQLLLADNTRSSQNNANPNGTSAYPDKTLPKDIFFVASQSVVDTRDATAMANVSSAGNTSADNTSSAGAGWSEPIFFYPDGTTSTARLQLRNKEGRTIELFMRGLTGIVKVGDVTAAAAQNSF